jgi:hypothetical protein
MMKGAEQAGNLRPDPLAFGFERLVLRLKDSEGTGGRLLGLA